MDRTYIEILEELQDCLEKTCSDDTVSFTFTMNGTCSSFEFEKRTKAQLDAQGISMRNIKGGFIK